MFKRPPYKTLFALALAPALLSACAGSKADYPSFALPTADQSTGRVSMRFPSIKVPQTAQNAQTGAVPLELEAQLAAINALASNAGQRFNASLASARQSIAAASNASTDSDRWARAQVQYADLTSHHGAGRLALAELDLLASRIRLADADNDELSTITQLQTNLARKLDEQSQILNALNADLDR